MTTPRVSSEVASHRTLKRRSNEMEQMRDIVSKGSSSEQMKYEVKTLTKDERQSLLDDVLHQDTTIAIPSEEVLAMKADLSITWSKLRMMRRYGKELNINIYSTQV